MSIHSRENAPTPHQRHHSTPTCCYAQQLPDFTVTLSVTRDGALIAQTVDLERSQVRDELHRLRALFALSAGYDITATSKERTA